MPLFQKKLHKWVDHVYEIMSHQNVSIFDNEGFPINKD